MALNVSGGTPQSSTHGQEIGSAGSPSAPEDIFETYPAAQFTVVGVELAFPVRSIRESGGNRIVERERPFRDGAKLDDTGSKAKRWTMEVIFENTIIEPDVNSINKGLPLYPDVLNKLIEQFDTHETGDLIVPTIGKVRARAESYARTETFGDRNQALVTFTFIEDNEDAIDFRSIAPASASANGRRLASTAEFDEQSSGAWSEDLSETNEDTSFLEDLVNSTGEVDVVSITARIQGNARGGNRSFLDANRPGRNLFFDPANSRGPRKLVRQQDLAARESDKARRGRPKLIGVIFRESTTIFRVGAFAGQDPADLMVVNPELDPFFIPALTVVKLFATTALLNGTSSAA